MIRAQGQAIQGQSLVGVHLELTQNRDEVRSRSEPDVKARGKG